MTHPPDLITVVKRIANEWKHQNYLVNEYTVKNSDAQAAAQRMRLAYRYSLEFCGLTLTEIIELDKSDDIDKTIEKLFEKSDWISFKVAPPNP